MTTCPDYQATGKEPFYPFPRTWWSTPVPTNPGIAPNSAQLVSNLVNQISTEYGTVNVDQGPSRFVVHGRDMGWQEVAISQPRAGSPGDLSVPIPPGIATPPGTDEDLVIWDVQFEQVGGYDGPMSYEFWGYSNLAARTFFRGPANGTWEGVFPWSAEPSGLENTVSSSGISIAGGTITYAECLWGAWTSIKTLNVGKVTPSPEFTPPAMQSDGRTPLDQGGIPYGTRFFMPEATPEPDGLSPFAKIAFAGLKRFGLIVQDQTQGSGCDLICENYVPWQTYKPGIEWPYDPAYAYSALNGIPWSSLAVLAP